MKIVEMCAEERPREKMLSKGVKSLSSAELIAIFLRAGTRKRNAVEVAQNLMKDAEGKLFNLSRMSLDRLCAHEGIGKSKAVAILAALELGRRFFEEAFPVEKISLNSPKQIYSLMAPHMKGLDHEECWVLYLNRTNYLLGKEMMSSGGANATLIDTKYIIRKVLEKQATGVILVHNHPAGNPAPSLNDFKQTRILKTALEAFEISLLDHVILSDGCFFSFDDNKVTHL